MTATEPTLRCAGPKHGKARNYRNPDITTSASGIPLCGECALNTFLSTPSNYKPKATLATAGVNDTEIPKATRAKSHRIYLSDGRYFEDELTAARTGRPVYAALTTWKRA